MKTTLILFLLVINGLCHAVTMTTADGLNIDADVVEMNFKTGVFTHEGNVSITKEGLSFNADYMEERRQNNEVTELKAHGSPMVYINTLRTDQGVYRGEAKELHYDKYKGKVTLTNYVLVDAAGNTHTGRNQGTFTLKTD